MKDDRSTPTDDQKISNSTTKTEEEDVIETATT